MERDGEKLFLNFTAFSHLLRRESLMVMRRVESFKICNLFHALVTVCDFIFVENAEREHQGTENSSIT